MSQLVHVDSVGMWSLDDTDLGDGVGGIADYFGEYDCEYLEDGEMARMGSIAVSESYWPLGKNGIAKKVESLNPPPGIYILTASAGTLPCTLDTGEEVVSGPHSLIAAFEVR